MQKPDKEQKEDLSLSRAAEMLLDECRMVLPGIQALFGFQLIAVFSERFGKLTETQQQLHGFAIGLVLLAIMIIMAPAAYHRLQGGMKVTGTFVIASTRLLLLSMIPLAVAFSLDFYVVLATIFHEPVAAVAAVILFAGFVLLWFVVPRLNIYDRLFRKG
jgi:uncharacterized protein DUF6328